MKYQLALYQVIISQVNHSYLAWAKLGIFLRFLPTMFVNTTYNTSSLKDRRHRQRAWRQETPVHVCSECPLLLHAIPSYQASATADLIIMYFSSGLFHRSSVQHNARDPVLKSVPQTSNNFFPLQTTELLFFPLSEKQKMKMNPQFWISP